MNLKYMSLITIENTTSYESTYLISSILLFILTIIIAVLLFLNKKENEKHVTYEPKIGDSDKEIQKYLPDMTEQKLLNTLYDKFVEIETAYMNCDYGTLKKCCTNELYESYKLDIENLKSNKTQCKIKNIISMKSNITGIVKENEYITIKMYLQVFIKYDLEEYDKNKRYILNFIIKDNNNEIICPSCGAKVENGLSECKYCHTIINNNYIDFVLSSKKETN